jgi:hypothetical protein
VSSATTTSRRALRSDRCSLLTGRADDPRPALRLADLNAERGSAELARLAASRDLFDEAGDRRMQ